MHAGFFGSGSRSDEHHGETAGVIIVGPEYGGLNSKTGIVVRFTCGTRKWRVALDIGVVAYTLAVVP